MKTYKIGKEIAMPGCYFVRGELSELRMDTVIKVQSATGEISNAVVVTRTGGGAAVRLI